MTAQDSAARRFYRLLAWLLTPVVAWAVSFLGGWVGAAVLGSVRGLIWGSALGAVVGTVGWAVWMVRSGRGRTVDMVDSG